MKLFILLLILIALIQTSFLPFNLVLVALLSRSLITEAVENYYLAFGIGIFLGVLASQNIGFWPIVFLLTVKLAYIVKKFPLSANAFTVIPIALVVLVGVEFLQQLVFAQSFDFKKTVTEAALTFPAYLIIKFWEERFIVKREIKLKIRG